MFQYKAIRIVTKRADEFIFDFQKVKHAHKVLEVLIGGGAAERKQAWKDNDPDADQQKEPQPMCKNVNNHLLTNMEYYQHSWQRGMLTNGEYLLYLNFIAHRSFNDPT